MSESDERAVSELVGFVFVFAIVILSIVLVSVTGYAGLEQSREAERVNNAERGFDLLADNVDDVVRGAPCRTTELRVNDANVVLGEPILVTVSGHPVGEPSTQTFVDQIEVRPIVYDDGGTRLTYAFGAVVRTDRGGTVLLREPDLLVSGNETVLVVAQPAPVDSVGVGGVTNVHLRATGGPRNLPVATTTPHVVTIEFTATDSDIETWSRVASALDDADPAVTCDPPDDDTVSCEVTTDRTYVTVVDVEVRFD
jgi:hypothetical protein